MYKPDHYSTLPKAHALNQQENGCEHFNKAYYRDEKGRIMVPLPLSWYLYKDNFRHSSSSSAIKTKLDTLGCLVPRRPRLWSTKSGRPAIRCRRIRSHSSSWSAVGAIWFPVSIQNPVWVGFNRHHWSYSWQSWIHR